MLYNFKRFQPVFWGHQPAAFRSISAMSLASSLVLAPDLPSPAMSGTALRRPVRSQLMKSEYDVSTSIICPSPALSLHLSEGRRRGGRRSDRQDSNGSAPTGGNRRGSSAKTAPTKTKTKTKTLSRLERIESRLRHSISKKISFLNSSFSVKPQHLYSSKVSFHHFLEHFAALPTISKKNLSPA